MSKMGETVREWGMLYKAVAKPEFLYESESWVVTGAIHKVLEAFQHLVSRRITGMMAQRKMGGECECPPLDEALETAGI